MFARDLPGGGRLRLLEEADADELFALVDRNREHLGPWLPWVPLTRSREESLEFIRLTRRQLADNDGFQAAIEVDGAIAGMVGFHRVDWNNRATSIGYWLAGDQQGRGIMTQAVRAFVHHAFAAWGMHRVVIEAATGNARSRAIPQRLGFREEGVRRGAERNGDDYLDLVTYALLATDPRGAAASAAPVTPPSAPRQAARTGRSRTASS